MNKKTSSKTSLKINSPLPQPAKNHTSKSSAKMTKNALVQPRRKVISKSTLIDLPKEAKNLTDTSRRRINPSSEKRSTTVVSFAKNAVTLPEIVQTSLLKLFVSFNT